MSLCVKYPGGSAASRLGGLGSVAVMERPGESGAAVSCQDSLRNEPDVTQALCLLGLHLS